jgi:glycosyltransferase involved in cell wall biosynthesis
MTKRLKIFTWHVHGNYLYYLTQTPCDFYLPKGAGEGYGGRTPNFPWGDNVHDVPAGQVRTLDVDCILFQSRRNYEADQFNILSEKQRALPKIYLEHDPPREHPTDTRHIVDDPDMLLVHVTHFNELMWDSGRTPTRVIPHGVLVPPEVRYRGELPRGIVVVNNLAARGRRLGLDVFERVRQDVPLDLAGMGSETLGGLGSVPPRELPALLSRYRFFFNPIRYTSLGLAVCEAMTVGLPVVGLATTEMPAAVQSGVTGYTATNPATLVPYMHRLLDDPALARRLSQNAARSARKHFNITRFTRDWLSTFEQIVARG